MKKRDMIVLVPCARCNRPAELAESEWSPTRKPWCQGCKEETNTCGSRSVLSGSQARSRKIRRKQSAANRKWRKKSADARAGIIRVIKVEEIEQ